MNIVGQSLGTMEDVGLLFIDLQSSHGGCGGGPAQPWHRSARHQRANAARCAVGDAAFAPIVAHGDRVSPSRGAHRHGRRRDHQPVVTEAHPRGVEMAGRDRGRAADRMQAAVAGFAEQARVRPALIARERDEERTGRTPGSHRMLREAECDRRGLDDRFERHGRHHPRGYGRGERSAADVGVRVGAHVAMVSRGEVVRPVAEHRRESTRRHPRIRDRTHEVAVCAPRPRERASHQSCATRIEREVANLPRQLLSIDDRLRWCHVAGLAAHAEAPAEVAEQPRESLRVRGRIARRHHQVQVIGHQHGRDRLDEDRAQPRPRPPAGVLSREHRARRRHACGEVEPPLIQHARAVGRSPPVVATFRMPHGCARGEPTGRRGVGSPATARRGGFGGASFCELERSLAVRSPP